MCRYSRISGDLRTNFLVYVPFIDYFRFDLKIIAKKGNHKLSRNILSYLFFTYVQHFYWKKRKKRGEDNNIVVFMR